MQTTRNLISHFVSGGSNSLDFPSRTLEEMYRTYSVSDADGHTYPLDGVVTIPHANAIYRTIKTYRPQAVLEVGMAYGASTIAILSALEANDKQGTLTSIDPAQSSYWHNIGVVNVKRSDLALNHKLIEQPDYVALPNLLAERVSFDFAYIDGWHTFDYTLLDFFYIDRMLKVGGIVAFNDCYLAAVKKVLGFLKTHRHYQEINVGLTPSFVSRNVKRMIRNVVTLTSKQDRYFQKQEVWEPNWDYYARF
jgi:predicted O-methyltransferase YrrM